jgi:hypothetical protein
MKTAASIDPIGAETRTRPAFSIQLPKANLDIPVTSHYESRPPRGKVGDNLGGEGLWPAGIEVE